MSNLATALNGASYTGYVTVSERGLTGMITLRADLSDKKVATAVKKATGQALPAVRQISGGDVQVAWMAPDEALILCDYAKAPALAKALEDALGDIHALVFVVSDARASFTVKGAGALEVMAKVCPLDIGSFTVGEMRRTRLAQVAAAMWMEDAETVHLVCFRSGAGYVFDALSVVARPGAEVFSG